MENNKINKKNNNKISKKGKILIIILGILLVIGLIVFYIIPIFGKKHSIKNNEVDSSRVVNTNKGVTEEKQLNGFIFSETSIVYENGLSKVKTKVTNNTGSDYNKESFNILLKDKNDKVIRTISGYLSGILKNGDSHEINTYVPADLTDVIKLEFEEKE